MARVVQGIHEACHHFTPCEARHTGWPHPHYHLPAMQPQNFASSQPSCGLSTAATTGTGRALCFDISHKALTGMGPCLYQRVGMQCVCNPAPTAVPEYPAGLVALGVITLLAIGAVLALAARQRRQDRARSGLKLDKPSDTAMLGEPAESHILPSAIPRYGQHTAVSGCTAWRWCHGGIPERKQGVDHTCPHNVCW